MKRKIKRPDEADMIIIRAVIGTALVLEEKEKPSGEHQ